MRSMFKKTAIALLVSAAISEAQAAQVTLDEIANKAVQSNPDIVSKWHEFKASVSERDTTWGRNLPTLDALYGTAYQRQKNPLYTPAESTRSYNNQTSSVTLSQNLFDGFATLNDTRRLEHASLVRFYEMLDLSESTALDAATAYIDVWRHRQLVEFAQDNYVTHRLVYVKVAERAKSGVGRQVDMETAAGRLALAESNLTTATANLHDVSARYQRIIGELPKDDMAQPPNIFAKDLPKDRAQSVAKGFEKSPRLKAAFENILSAKRNVEVQRAGYYPRIDAYLEKQHDLNDTGYTNPNGGSGVTDISTAGLTFSWNLFRGFQDSSKKLKAAEEVYMAKDQREKTCRDVRQTLSMSFNDHHRLTEQLAFLDQHQLSTDKIREAFRNQYDIGQRTLLDVLDTENEYYTAQQDSLNAEMDLLIADAKYQAAAGNLLNTLKLKNLDMTPPAPKTTPDEDMLTTCPDEPVGNLPVDKDALFRAALEKDRLTHQPAVTAAVAPAPSLAVQIIKAAKPVVIKDVNFAYKSAKLKSAAGPKLMPVVEFAKKYPEADMEVTGHTDDIGGEAYNLKLSEKRAESVKKWLVKNGVDAKRIITKGMGKSQPISSNQTDAGRAENRRVEIHYTVREE
jgi:adhesin transport system outer membrane protein